MKENAPRRVFRFGPFEADQRTEELRKQGRRLALQGQPLQVLLMLLNRPGELVTRGEIQQALWPDGTFVDFDHGLNTAINKIRDALDDSAANPRYVETLARRGYRFIAEVEVIAEPATPVSQPGPSFPQATRPADARQSQPARTSMAETTPKSGSSPAPQLLTSPHEMPQASGPVVRVLFLLLQTMYLTFYAISLARLSVAQDTIRHVVAHPLLAVALIVVTAVVGIPIRLYLISAVAFNAPGLRERFLRIFPVIFPLDELWALAPFLLTKQIGYGLALGITAALLYVPFAQRSLILMGAGAPARAKTTA